MTTLAELQAKQAKELQLLEKQVQISELLPNVKFSLSIGWKTEYNLRFDLKNSTPEQVKEVVKLVTSIFTPSNDKHPIYDCLYYFNFRNPCKYEYSIDFCYMHNGISIDFDLPLSSINTDLLSIGSRKITDCEYHYFIGMTVNKMLKMEFRTYQLKDNILKQPVIKYFGGNKSYKSNFKNDYKKILSIIL